MTAGGVGDRQPGSDNGGKRVVQASAQSARVPGPGSRGSASGLTAPRNPNSTFSGSHAAVALCADAAADPSGPLVGVIVGRGGTGKTAMLDALASIYSAAGVTVHRDASAWPPPEDAVLLIDDARNLPDEVLLDLRRMVEAGRQRIVVATRPGPDLPNVDALAAALGRQRAPIVLGRLSRAEVTARVEGLCSGSGSAALAAFVHEQTAGTPKLVDALASALCAAGLVPDGPGHAGWAPAKIPTSVLELLRLDLSALGPEPLSLLLALAVGAELNPQLLADVLNSEPASVEHAAEVARASGLLTETGALLPLARHALLTLAPPMRIQAMRTGWVAAVHRRGGSMLEHARALAGAGMTGPEVGAVLAAGAAEAPTPTEAVKLYAAAVQAGTPIASVAAKLGRASALVGDLNTALRLADIAISDANAPDRDVAVAVAATVLATRGMLSRTAQLYRWWANTTGEPPVLAVPALLGVGDLPGARAALEHGLLPAPTLSDGVETLLAEGVLESVTGTPSLALSLLARAAMLLEPAAERTLMPDTPAALAAIVALNCGEFDVAESVLTRAVASRLGGEPAMSRYRLLQAWTAMQRGDLETARALVGSAGPGGGALEPREELTAAAIEVGLARREGDLGALNTAWQRARQAIVRHPVDLFALHAVGELAVAAARLQEESWIRPHLSEAWALLDRLGQPALWATPMHWYAVQAASLADRPADAESHIAVLEAAAPTYPQAAVLAAAARSWLRVMAGQVDATEVEAAARRLHSIGHAWDASRLAGQAAVRTGDRQMMSALMSVARSLRPAAGGSVSAETAGLDLPAETPAFPSPTRPADSAPAPSSSSSSGVSLSEREREVAALLVTGLTYKEIGERLFISAKTVEHHVARMRQRLGAGSRGELFSQLRAALDNDA
ncbi:LuxR C-terminal-related transcriptional regulator [Sporichthya polymorpha]|uniref:LuxR C-terminal-related transcriptional regulator n=1 Tax=Sporichthya polymorpha TaxID=35751 RepID=UPI0003655F5A|nr:LuxR C-terminal-related transcriptional regulator [Sporichthya polymorpha]